MKTTTTPFSAFVMVALALDWYLCIVYPFKHIMAIKRAKLAVMVFASLTFVIGIICSLMFGTYEIVTENPNKCVAIIHGDHVLNRSELITTTMTVDYFNEHENNKATHLTQMIGDVIYTGFCLANTLIFDKHFFRVNWCMHLLQSETSKASSCKY